MMPYIFLLLVHHQSPAVPASQAVNEGEVDPFVELALYDPASNNTDVLWSSQMVNEPNPKWGEKFDFTMISATSRLNITVWDKLNFFEGRFSLKGLTGALTPTWVLAKTLPRAGGGAGQYCSWH